MVVVGFGLGLWMAVEKNQKNPSIFALSTVFRRRLPFDERSWFFVPFGWLTPFFFDYWRYSICLGGGSIWLGWREAVKVSFWSVLPVFLFDITTSSHACFSLSRAQIDVSFNLEHRGGFVLAWTRCFGFVLAFLVVWVRFVSWELHSSFAFSNGSNAFLSLIVISFDKALS